MTRKKRSAYFDPVLDDWKKIANPRVWEVAAMMRGYDPRAMTDVTDSRGDDLDLAFEIRMLTSAVAAGTLSTIAPTATADAQTELTADSVVSWLRANGHSALANGLSPAAIHSSGTNRWTAEFSAEVEAFREKHGTKAAAEKYGVSTARIRKKLPRDRVATKANNPFGLDRKAP